MSYHLCWGGGEPEGQRGAGLIPVGACHACKNTTAEELEELGLSVFTQPAPQVEGVGALEVCRDLVRSEKEINEEDKAAGGPGDGKLLPNGHLADGGTLLQVCVLWHMCAVTNE